MSAAMLRCALIGNPNCGKTALFNLLTGSRQKVANYAGVTVERKEGQLRLPDGRHVVLLDLPGAYSLTPASLDEAIARDVCRGFYPGEPIPDLLVCVVSATNLRLHLRFALEVRQLGRPMVVALNQMDVAARRGIEIDMDALSRELGVPVIPTVAVKSGGGDKLLARIAEATPIAIDAAPLDDDGLHAEARRLMDAAVRMPERISRLDQRLDGWLLNPVLGLVILAVVMFTMFQAVFAWAQAPADALDGLIQLLQARITAAMPDTLLRGLIVDGVIGGVGAVVVFLPQILILFLFILVLEASGYMVRAAFLMDRLMARVGLSGRTFIPLLSSFACAVPGIMATRTIDDPKDRLTTILIAPLMTCSARLPVYAVIIAAFIPDRAVGGIIGLQGLVLFGLYMGGILGALGAALLLRSTVTKGHSHGFLMEMPKYQLPILRDIVLGLWQRAWIFLKRAGTIILASTVILWVLLTFPQPPANADKPGIDYSIAAKVADGLEHVFRPIGFNREMSLALIPAMAAREVAVSALGTVYSIQGKDEDQTQRSLVERLRGRWSLPTALAFLVWFVFAPQCISTIAVVRRETNGWKWPAFMLGYLFALAYLAAGATFWLATALGL